MILYEFEARRLLPGPGRLSQDRTHDVRIELSGAGNEPVAPPADLLAHGCVEKAADHVLDNGIPLFDDDELVDGVEQLADEAGGEGIGANAKVGGNRFAGLEIIEEVVGGHAGEEVAGASRRGVEHQLVEGIAFGPADDIGLFASELVVAHAGIGRQQGPLGRELRGLEGVGRTTLADLHAAAAVGEPGHEPEHHGHLDALGQLEGGTGHVVAFLLRGRLEARDEREVRVHAAVLLVLAGVHAGIVGDRDDQAAFDAGDGRVHKRVGGDIEANVLERDQRASSGVADAEGLLEGDLFVGRPCVGHASLSCARHFVRLATDELEDFGGGRSRIGEGSAEAGVNCGEGDGFVAKQWTSLHRSSVRSPRASRACNGARTHIDRAAGREDL